jgi:hypothetical protein
VNPMFVLLRATLLGAGALLLVAQAKVEDAPADTTTFVSTCATNFEVCRNEVLDVSNYNMIQMMGGKRGCTFPHTDAKIHADSTAATNAIIDWLKTNEAFRAPKTDDSIAQAMEKPFGQACVSIDSRATGGVKALCAQIFCLPLRN